MTDSVRVTPEVAQALVREGGAVSIVCDRETVEITWAHGTKLTIDTSPTTSHLGYQLEVNG